MNKELKIEWLAALRSGEFEQGQGYLRQGNKYCCLGVLCELTARKGLSSPAFPAEGIVADGVYQYNGDTGMPSQAHDRVTGLDLGNQSKLAWMNDEGKSFAEIADWIERNVSDYPSRDV